MNVSSTYFNGTISSLKEREHWVAIIGSRKANAREIQIAYHLAKKSVEKGKVVVSGLALGIDAAAHKGALDAGGETIAILNTTSKEPVRPSSNIPLAERILKQGGIITPFDEIVSSSDERSNQRYIERNILLAHLCPIIIVVQDKNAPIQGGTRWATKYGLDLNKIVQRIDADAKFDKFPKVTQKTEVNWNMEFEMKDMIQKLEILR